MRAKPSKLELRFNKRRRAQHNNANQPYELFKFHRHEDPTRRSHVAIYNQSRFHSFLQTYDEGWEEAIFQGRPIVYGWARFNMDANHFQFDRSRDFIRDPNSEEWPGW